MRTYAVIFHPLRKKVLLNKPTTITNAAAQLGLNVVGPCGGNGKCGKCRVKIVRFPEDTFLPPDPESKRLLSETDLKKGFRLACTTKIRDDIELELPSWTWEPTGEHTKLAYRALTEGKIDPEIDKRYPLDAGIKSLVCSLPKPTLDDNISDLERLKRCIGKGVNVDYNEIKLSKNVIQDLTTKLHDNDWQVQTVFSVTSERPELLAILPADLKRKSTEKTEGIFGVAIDIGTSTIAAYLLDLRTGQECSVASMVNPQIRIGADVISRIRYAMQSADSAQLLNQILKDAINGLITSLCEDSNISPQSIFELVAVGNTTMLHNFLSLPVNQLGSAPYVPAFNGNYYTQASELGLNMKGNGKIYVGPIVAGFLGADAVGNALITNMLGNSNDFSPDGQVKLVIDIGTNSELLLCDQHRLIACSAAAGPAFEGGNLQFGIRAFPGAVDSISVSRGRVSYSTMEGRRACGITGSGVVEGIGEFLRVGAIRNSGSIDRDTYKGWLKYPKRIKLHPTKEPTPSCDLVLPELKIVPRTKSALDSTITITQNDIREIQLAKAAIRTGIDILMSELGVTIDDLDVLYLAGAFGNYLKPRSAVEINLLPDIELEKVKSIGNAAGSSAKILLRSRAARDVMKHIANKIEYIDLAMHSKFQDLFIKNMEF